MRTWEHLLSPLRSTSYAHLKGVLCAYACAFMPHGFCYHWSLWLAWLSLGAQISTLQPHYCYCLHICSLVQLSCQIAAESSLGLVCLISKAWVAYLCPREEGIKYLVALISSLLRWIKWEFSREFEVLVLCSGYYSLSMKSVFSSVLSM